MLETTNFGSGSAKMAKAFVAFSLAPASHRFQLALSGL
jgi:hypothetical protein